MGSTYRPSPWPIDPEQLPWWSNVAPEAAVLWRSGRIRRVRESFFVASALWALFTIVLLAVQRQPAGGMAVWLLFPLVAVVLGAVGVRVPTGLLMTYLFSAALLCFVAVYASRNATSAPVVTAGMFVLLAAFHAGLPLLARAYATDRAVPRQSREHRVFGRTGTALARVRGWRREAVDSGLLGEELTGELLERYLIRIPSARIFHSLRWPGPSAADVDHAVLCGRRLVLIDSKRWIPGNYTLTADNVVLREGRPFLGSEIRLPHAVAAYQRLLPRCDVHGIVLIHPNRDGTVTTTTHAGAGVEVLTAQQFLTQVGAWLARQPYLIDTRAVALLTTLVHRSDSPAS